MRAALPGFAILCLALAGPGCGGSAGSSHVASADPPPSRTVDPHPDVPGREPTAAELRAIAPLLETAERLRGLTFARPVPFRVQSRAVITAFVREQTDAEELEQARVFYVALGLLDPDLDVHALIVRVLGEQIVGYYDPEQSLMVIREDVAEGLSRRARTLGGARALGDSEMVIVHELVHALQDQRLGLGETYEQERTIDADNALAALVEGDATLAMIGHMADQRPGGSLARLTSNPALVRMLLNDNPTSVSGQEIGEAPPIVRVPLIARYIEGLMFCVTLHGGGGWAEVDRAHRAHPVSTEQILHPEKYAAGEGPETIEMGPLPALLEAGLRVHEEDTLGELEMGIYFGLGDPSADAVPAPAAGWGGDRLRVYRREDGTTAAVWFTRFDDVEEAREAEAAFEAVRAAAPTDRRSRHRGRAARPRGARHPGSRARAPGRGRRALRRDDGAARASLTPKNERARRSRLSQPLGAPMPSQVNEIDPVTVEVEVSVPWDHVRARLDSGYSKLQKNARVRGFRRGKVPRRVLKQLYGDEVHSEVIANLVETGLLEAVTTHDLAVVASPEVRSLPAITKGEPLAFTARVEVRPKVGPVAFEGMELERPIAPVTDEDVEAELQALRERAAELETPEEPRPSKNGDIVTIDFKVFVGDEEILEAGGDGKRLELGSGTILPDLEEGLVDVDVGDTVQIEHDFDEETPNANLKGKTATFYIDVIDIQEKILPDLDDEFAIDLGRDLETLEALRRRDPGAARDRGERARRAAGQGQRARDPRQGKPHPHPALAHRAPGASDAARARDVHADDRIAAEPREHDEVDARARRREGARRHPDGGARQPAGHRRRAGGGRRQAQRDRGSDRETYREGAG